MIRAAVLTLTMGAVLGAQAPVPAQTVAPVTELKGAGVKLLVNLSGYKQSEGFTPFSKTYFSLGQFSAEPTLSSRLGGNFIISFLVDDAPQGATPARLAMGVVGGRFNSEKAFSPRAGEGSSFQVQKLEKPDGVFLTLLLDASALSEVEANMLTTAKLATGLKEQDPVQQLNYYFETLVGDKWVEIHASSLLIRTQGESPKDLRLMREEMIRILASLQLQKL